MACVYDFTVRDIDGQERALSAWRGQPLLIVNVASQCGFTPQYRGLEALWQRWRERGLVVLGFPCDQFGHQEPGSEAEIKQFCSSEYGVSFPMFAKIAVNGPASAPLYQWLRREGRGVLGSEKVKWNFTKFLTGREGEVLKRFAPATKPAALEAIVERLLGQEA